MFKSILKKFSDKKSKDDTYNNFFDMGLISYMPKKENYIISPFSLRVALSMIVNELNNTASDKVLKILNLSNIELYKQYNFNIANSIWSNTDLNNKANTIFANKKVRNINNKNGKIIINKWIEEETKGKITNAIDDSTIHNMTLLFINVIYFKDKWLMPFDPEYTSKDVFIDIDGNSQVIEFMNNVDMYSYFEDENIKMIAKPYNDNNIKMYFVLPKNNKFINLNFLNYKLKNMYKRYINFKIPKFKIEYSHFNLIDVIGKIGFHNLGVKSILQKALIEVDEEGTEAISVTLIDSFGCQEDSESFECNKPFMYFIRNDATGDILFVGQYAYADEL